MVNFRFHLVSLTAVFLALALGIAIGATVLDRSTVSLLERRLDTIKSHSDATNRQNDQLRAALGRWNQFADQAGDRLVQGRLAGVSVVVVAVEGVDGDSLNALRQTLANAGATLEGTLWMTAKLAVRNNDDLATLRDVLNVPNGRPADLRRLVASDAAAAITDSSALAPLAALIDRGFARVEAPGGAAIGPAGLLSEGSRFVVVSDAKAAVPNPEVAQPLVEDLSARAPGRIVAAEDGHDANGKDPAVRAVFVGPLRSEAALKVSTVDDLEEYAGRVATVFALVDISAGRTGHYGVGPGASRLLPVPPT